MPSRATVKFSGLGRLSSGQAATKEGHRNWWAMPLSPAPPSQGTAK